MPTKKPPQCVWVLYARGRSPRIYINAPTRALREGEELALYNLAASFTKATHPQTRAKRGER